MPQRKTRPWAAGEKSILSALELAVIKNLQHQNRRNDAADILINATCSLDKNGGVVVPICAKAMDKLYDFVQKSNIDSFTAHSW